MKKDLKNVLKELRYRTVRRIDVCNRVLEICYKLQRMNLDDADLCELPKEDLEAFGVDHIAVVRRLKLSDLARDYDKFLQERGQEQKESEACVIKH